MNTHCEHHWATRNCEKCELQRYDKVMLFALTVLAVVAVLHFMVEPQINLILHAS